MTEHNFLSAEGATKNDRRLLVSRLLITTALLSAAAAAERPCPPSLMGDGDTNIVGTPPVCPTGPAGESDTPDYADPLESCAGLLGRRIVQVSTAAALQQAASNANCGDTIQLAPGTYGAEMSIRKDCPMTAPVIIQGAANFGSTYTANLDVEGARTIVTGIRFSGPEARVKLGGTNNKLIANRFSDWRSIAVVASVGKEGEIAYNEFSRPYRWLESESGSYPLRIGIRTSEKDPTSFHFNAWVHHNYFHDFPQKPNPNVYDSGQSDAIEVCQSGRSSTALMRTGWYLESNLIERHLQGHGILDLKCGGNVVRYNTVLDSPGGRLDARGGSYNVIESNWIENSGGSTIHGGYNKIVGNHVRGGPINVMAGDFEWNLAGGGHARAYRTVLAANDASSVNVGKSHDPTTEYPASETVVEGHVGPDPVLGLQVNTTIRSSSSARFAAPFKLSSDRVGPSALSGASPQYRSCRVP
jgi:Chondroitinase B